MEQSPKQQPRPPPSSRHSPTYRALLAAGPRLRPLKQVHARLVVSGLHASRPLLTKLVTFAGEAGPSASSYARLLFNAVAEPDSFLFNSLIRVSSRSGLSAEALLFYRRMWMAGLPRSNYTFTSVIKACANLSALRTGKAVHSHLVVDGFDSDCYVQTALVALYGKSGDLHVAHKIFDRIPSPNLVAWNTMISVYEQNGLAHEAIRLFHMMDDARVEPDSATLVSLLSACCHIGDLHLGEWVRNYVTDRGMDLNVILGTSLINMYARCGQVHKAREVFDELQNRNVIAWTAMLSGYGMHGYGHQAVELFHQMRRSGPVPNDVTFVAILSACAHSGLVKEGQEIFKYMKREYGLSPREEHYVCMVDMLGRAGFLDEALHFIDNSVHGLPGPAVWTAMLGACKMHKDFDLGVKVAEKLIAVEPENPAHYVLLSNVFALAGQMDRVESVRDIMINKRLRKQVGYSSIEVHDVVHVFRMGDTSHPQTVEIHHYLEQLIKKMREAGYAPEIDSVMHELEEEEREFALRFHSEKLAIAFGIMSTRDGGLIRVVKNLRMCDDCHTAIKFMSVVASREIIVRDRYRFHHFKDGLCSCKDFW